MNYIQMNSKLQQPNDFGSPMKAMQLVLGKSQDCLEKEAQGISPKQTMTPHIVAKITTWLYP